MPDAPRKFSHRATGKFWIHYRQLPPEIQNLGDKTYLLLKKNPRHPSLQFKKVGKVWLRPCRSASSGSGDKILEGYPCFWIGLHDEYDLKIK